MSAEDAAMKKVILQVIDDAIGGAYDNAYRASMAFKGMTKAQMREEYGSSGETRQQVLDGYKRPLKKLENARDWFLTLNLSNTPVRNI